MASISKHQWQQFQADGFLPLGPVLEPHFVQVLKGRADALAVGEIRRDGVLVQRDTGGSYESLPAALPQGEIADLIY